MNLSETAAEKREELRLSLLMTAVYAIVGVQLPFLPVWLSSQGLEPAEIGAILATPPALRVLAALIVPRRADRTGRHGEILVGFAFCAGLAYALLGLMQGFAPILITVAILAFAQGPIFALADGVILGAAQRRRAAGRPTLHYSFVRGWGSVAILGFMLASGPIARALPDDDLVWLLAGVSFLAAIVAFVALAGVRGAKAGPRANAATQRLARPEVVIGVIAATALIQGSHAFVLTFGALHWKAVGHDETFVSVAWAAALVTEVAFFLAAGRWFGGERRAATYLILGGAAAVLRWALMASEPATAGILAAQALHGLSCAAVQLGPAYLLAQLCGAGRLAQAQGWAAAANAAMLSLATLASGPLYSRFGESSYLAMAAMAGAGFMLSLLLARAPQERPASGGTRARLRASEQV